ncbi:hypothetical protein CEXT_702991 [Caerostris extrusa]|uniref:Uncharacterized protein n=1 Tax=Caerostris extrusa TaxID=172846 RepID=A0AAV4UCZ3_CAEEX|nr:hypothetical protein CEXT_702991 [Caerostris extrusa]
MRIELKMKRRMLLREDRCYLIITILRFPLITDEKDQICTPQSVATLLKPLALRPIIYFAQLLGVNAAYGRKFVIASDDFLVPQQFKSEHCLPRPPDFCVSNLAPPKAML